VCPADSKSGGLTDVTESIIVRSFSDSDSLDL